MSYIVTKKNIHQLSFRQIHHQKYMNYRTHINLFIIVFNFLFYTYSHALINCIITPYEFKIEILAYEAIFTRLFHALTTIKTDEKYIYFHLFFLFQ